MTTVKEVASRARVSVGTVSNVVLGAVPVSAKRRERVLAAIRQLGYHTDLVARSLKLRHTMTLGMIVSDITNPFFSQMVRGAEDAALERNYVLLIFNTDDRVEREKQVFSALRSRRVDGILLSVAPDNDGYRHISETLASGTPIVCLDRVPLKIAVDSVTVNNVKAAQECVQHLIALGHRQIGMLTGSMALQTARERLQGYRRALSRARIPIKRRFIREGDFRLESGYLLGRELLSAGERPSALFVSNGAMALGALKAIEELTLRCPEDIALAFFDDLPVAEIIRPRLTAVAQPAYLMGYKGVELLTRRLAAKGRKGGRRVTIQLPTELKIRESTAGTQSAVRPRPR